MIATPDTLFVPTEKSAGKAFIYTILGVYSIAYLVRYGYLYYFVSRNYTFSDINPEWNPIVFPSLTQSFLICSFIFGVFFLTSIPWSGRGAILRAAYVIPPTWVQVALVIFIALCTAIRYLFGARLGEETIALPLGVTAIVNRSISELIPGLILLMMEAFWFNSMKWNYRFWLFVLAAFNIGIAAIAASKAGMVFFAVELVLFMYLTGQPLFQKPVRWVIVAALILAAFIVGSEIRSQALGGGTSEYFTLLEQGDYLGTLLLVLGTLVNRVIGLEGYALSCGYNCTSLPNVIVPSFQSFFGEAGRIFTQEVVGVQRDFDYRSPGLLAGAALIAGTYAGGVLVFGFLRGSLGAIRLLDRGHFSTAFRVAIVFGLFRFIVEGTWDVTNLIAMIIGAILVETAARLLGSGLVDYSQKMTVAARATAAKKAVGHRS